MTVTEELAATLAEFYDDPVGFVQWAFPWGEEGTALESGPDGEAPGPRKWQLDFLREWGEEIKARDFTGVAPVNPIQIARASGHGIGKSALSAWIILFLINTRAHCKGVVTANTNDQLRTKTWGELAKWHNLSVTKKLFTYRNVKGGMCIFNNQHPDTWRVDALTCREENSEAFAGLHAANSTPFYLFDEASNIPEKIWEVAHGGLTDGEPMWFVFGNPTRNSGSFRQCFGRNRHLWRTDQIDSRAVAGTNKELFERWAEAYGEDSDFFRVRVKGAFPRAAVRQLIPENLVDAAQGKHLEKSQYFFAPRVLGVDVARYGDDKCTVYLRQGLASTKLSDHRGIDTMHLAGLVAQYEDRFATVATFVDETGLGAGVIDRLRQLGRDPIPVNFAAASNRPECKNKRAQIWCDLRDWLKAGGAIPDDQELRDDLVNQEFFFDAKNKIQLVKKEDMKKLGLASPDDGDGVALTFAEEVYQPTEKEEFVGTKNEFAKTEYNVFG